MTLQHPTGQLPISPDNTSNSACTANRSLPDTSIGGAEPEPVRLSVMGYNLGDQFSIFFGSTSLRHRFR
jgi:hypothetical protein